MFDSAMSSKEIVCYLRCVATAAAPQEGPSRLVLSVREAWRCLPCFSTKRVIATFSFPGDAWTRNASGDYESVAVCGISRGKLGKLRGMNPDLPVRVKACLQVGCSRNFLKGGLGDLLRRLEGPSPSSSASPGVSAPVGMPGSSATLWPSWATPDHQDVQPRLEQLDAGSGEQSLPAGVNSPPVTETSGEGTDGEERDTEGWVTFVNHDTGRCVRLPAHTEEEKAGRWSGPGAWTEEEDALDDQALRILSGRPSLAARKRGGAPGGRCREQEKWGPVSPSQPGAQQVPATQQLGSAVPPPSAATGDLEGHQSTVTLAGPSTLPPSPPSVQKPRRPRRWGLCRKVLLAFGLVVLAALLLGGDDSFLDTV